MSICSYVHMKPKGSSAAIIPPPADVNPSCAGPHLAPRDTTVRQLTLMTGRTVEALADTFRVLGDPTRVRILDALAPGELCVCDIASLVGISESAVSHQLRLLRGMRLVRPRRAGRLVYYAVDDHHILELLTQALRHVEEARSASADSAAATSEPLTTLPHRSVGREPR
jgi:ArsR family transcriptional regulator, lead/cadmium/zinc/bismuth-responsive transcriptional repressor